MIWSPWVRAGALLLATLAVSGCAEDPTIPVYMHHWVDTAATRAFVTDAAAVWGLGVDFRSRKRGSFRLTIHEHGIVIDHPGADYVELRGESTEKFGCRRAAWAKSEFPEILAHELGHILWMRHEPGTVMASWVEEGDRPTEAQRERFVRRLRKFRRRCP